MRVLAALLAGWTTVAGIAVAAGPAAPTPVIRYVTLNLYHGGTFSVRTGDDHELERRLEMAAAALRALQPDVVGVQEASTGPRRGHVAARLAARLGFHYVYAPAIRGLLSLIMNNLTEGPAVLSRFPILRSETRDLPRCHYLADPRAIAFAELETPWGRLPVFSTHISGNPCQSRGVLAFVRAHRGPLPGVLMGDFNAEEHAPAITLLTRGAGLVDVFRAANPSAAGPTVWQPVTALEPMARRRVDYLFLLPGTEVAGRVLSSRVVVDAPGRRPDGTVLWPSDHYGVLAEIALDPATSHPGVLTRAVEPAGPTARDETGPARPARGPIEEDPR
jgi:endonuclease/exonuclease/phosphatase family metal-dependent hydrolase